MDKYQKALNNLDETIKYYENNKLCFTHEEYIETLQELIDKHQQAPNVNELIEKCESILNIIKPRIEFATDAENALDEVWDIVVSVIDDLKQLQQSYNVNELIEKLEKEIEHFNKKNLSQFQQGANEQTKYVVGLLKQLQQPKMGIMYVPKDEVTFTWFEIVTILNDKKHHLYNYMIRFFGELEDYDEKPFISEKGNKEYNLDLVLCFSEDCNEFNHLELGIFNFKTDYLEVRKVYNNV